MWDIDGTLLTTARAGIYAWEEAAEIVIGKPFDFSSLETAGLTDMEIAAGILEAAGREGSRPAARELAAHYERLLPSALPRKQGRVIPGVREILERAGEQPEVLSMLLTGNTEKGGRAKLEHYSLHGYFSLGAFSGERHSRTEIACFAAEVAEKAAPGIGRDRMFVIGDTPHDVSCGQAIGANTIAVATGSYDRAALERCSPWRVLDGLSDTDEFFSLVSGEDRSEASGLGV